VDKIAKNTFIFFQPEVATSDRIPWFPVAGLSAIADVPGVTNGVVGVSAVPFEHAVAGGPAVTGFPAVEGVLVVASVPADPGVYI